MSVLLSNNTPRNLMNNKETKLSLCTICKKNQSIYKCPRCSTKTCSLQCCKTHKIQTNCNGKRDRTSYCSLNKFTNERLASDYHFLEDIMLVNDRGKRVARDMNGGNSSNNGTFKKRMKIEEDEEEQTSHVLLSSVQEQEEQQTNIPNYLQKLRHEAKIQHVTLLFMPMGMERRKNNTTRYHPKTNIINWKIEWKFVIPNNKNHTYKTYYTDHVSQEANIKHELDKLLRRKSVLCDMEVNLPSKWMLFLKPKPSVKFYNNIILDDKDNSLGAALKDTTIIEFPTFFVVNECDGIDYKTIFPLRIQEMDE